MKVILRHQLLPKPLGDHPILADIHFEIIYSEAEIQALNPTWAREFILNHVEANGQIFPKARVSILRPSSCPVHHCNRGQVTCRGGPGVWLYGIYLQWNEAFFEKVQLSAVEDYEPLIALFRTARDLAL